jgi:phosphatidylserine/phosphatidylglycerophosphate/cardiolipin synthase-like enzyme
VRAWESEEGITVGAIAGTHVVTLGLDLSAARRRRCLGFAIRREDKTEGESYWLRGMKSFPGVNLGPGGEASSRDQPFQTFQWADYSAKPDHEYAYTVVPLYGKPGALTEGPRIKVKVRTEVELGTPHSVFFNRGSVATQEYARRFQDKKPSELQGEEQAAAYAWLSRGLHEAMLAFFGRAAGKGWGLYGAIYELIWPDVIEALRQASRRGADVGVLYHGIPGETATANEEAIKAGRIKGLCKPRTTGALMHNKFFVLTKDDKPVAVWTGSTNATESGLFGHLNCGHIVEDAAVAAEYLDYWTEIRTSPENKVEKAWMGDNNPRPPAAGAAAQPLTAVFSPHKGTSVLDWYAEIAGDAKDALMMSFAFGMDKRFQQVYSQEDNVLRYALMDKAATGRRSYVEEQEKKIQAIRNRPNVVVAIGNRIATNEFDRWLHEIDRVIPHPNVRWVHTKFMLADPLGPDPVTITGSANWSEASTDENTENMIVIRGDKRVADIYLGEFMRLHSHYAFREAVSWAQAEKGTSAKKWKPEDLATDTSWQADYFDKTNERYWKRRYFSQRTS